MRDSPTFHAISSEEALIRECLHMGWPLDQQGARSTVSTFLATVVPPNRRADGTVDLYESLNRIRRYSWEHGSAIWDRYVQSRQREVEELAHPHAITVQLNRTIIGDGRGVSRIRVPLPFEHPSQAELSWSLIETGGQVEGNTSGAGYLDLKVQGAPASASVTIAYQAKLRPQTRESCASSRPGELTGLSTPYPISPLIEAQMRELSGIIDPYDRIYTLWNLFHSELLCGHVYHSEVAHKENASTAASTRWFDCVIASWNFATLTERLGVPARILSGLILNGFGPSPHFWCEVFINDSWIPVDFYAWDLSQKDPTWRDRFFGSLECRLRFECLPTIFSRFLPNVPWCIERESAEGCAIFTYRRTEDRITLAQDRWQVSLSQLD